MEKDSFAVLLILSVMGFTVSTSNLLLNPIISIYSTQYAGVTPTKAPDDSGTAGATTKN